MKRLAGLAGLALILVVLWPAAAGAGEAPDEPPPPAAAPTTAPPAGGSFGNKTFGGPYPPSRYTIKGKVSVTSPDDTWYTIATRNTFDASIWVNSLSMSETDWAWSYTVADAVRPHVVTLSEITHTRLVAQFQLRHAVLFFAAVFAGLLILRGKLGEGLIDGALSLICFLLAMHFIALQPLGFYDTAIGAMREVSTAATTDPKTGASGSDNLTDGIHRGLIAQPYEWISFGRPITGTPCQPGVDAALAPKKSGGGGGGGGIVGALVDTAGNVISAANPIAGGAAGGITDAIGAPNPGKALTGAAVGTIADQALNSNNPDDVKKALKDAGCESEAAWYGQPDGTKLFGSALVLLASLIVWVLVTALAVSIIFAQAFFAGIAVIGPVLPVLGALPGQSRDGFWKIVSFAGKLFIGVVAGSYMLVLAYGFFDAILSAGEVTGSMEARMGLLVIVSAGIFWSRKKLMAGAARMTGRMVGRLGALSPAASSKLTMMASMGAGAAAMNAIGASEGAGRARQAFHAGQHAQHQGRHMLHSRGGQLATGAGKAAVGVTTAGAGTIASAAGRGVARGARRAGVEVGKAHARLHGDPAQPDPGQHDPAQQASPDPATPRIRYQESSATRQARRIPRSDQPEWQHDTRDRLLRTHRNLRGEGENRPLRPDEIDPAMPEARRQRVAAMSHSLWEDQEALIAAQAEGGLKIHRQSPEERVWVRQADLTDPAEMTKLFRYQEEGRLRVNRQRLRPEDRPSQVISQSRVS